MASRSRSEYTATVAMPSSRQVRMTRTAISPRLAIRTFSNTVSPSDAVPYRYRRAGSRRQIGPGGHPVRGRPLVPRDRLDQHLPARGGPPGSPRGGGGPGRGPDRRPGPPGPDLGRPAGVLPPPVDPPPARPG